LFAKQPGLKECYVGAFASEAEVRKARQGRPQSAAARQAGSCTQLSVARRTVPDGAAFSANAEPKRHRSQVRQSRRAATRSAGQLISLVVRSACVACRGPGVSRIGIRCILATTHVRKSTQLQKNKMVSATTRAPFTGRHATRYKKGYVGK